VLAARDARQATMDRWLGAGSTVVAASLAIPGSCKAPAGAGALFEWAVAEATRDLPGARRVDATTDALGPFELWCTTADAVAAKRRCVAVEAANPAARLVDLDVYSPEGTPVDRASLDLPARRCLCCDEPARDCIRAGRHAPADVVASALRLLADLRG
jgi:holo-ACP synthase CitX